MVRVRARSSGVLDILRVALLLAVVIAVHLGIPGTIPSGGDGGNWLAIAREQAGADVMAADVGYPPVFPLLVAAGIPIIGSIPSLVLAALIAKGLLVVAVFVCLRPVGRWYALGGALIGAIAGAQLEAFAWGGYPQLMGTAFALLTVFMTMRWLAEARWSLLVLTVILGLLTFATHIFIAAMLVAALPLATIHWLLVTRADRRSWRRAIVSVGILTIPGAVFFVSSLLLGPQEAIAVLNPYGLDRVESIDQIIRDAPIPWILVIAMGIGGLAMSKLDRSRASVLAVGSSWTLVGLGVFVATAETRALLLSQMGLIILGCLATQRVFQWLGPRHKRKQHRISRVSFSAFVIVLVSTLSAVVIGGLVSYSQATSWYRVVDADVLRDLDWIKANTPTDTVIASSSGPNGNPLGWWTQGYAGRKTYTGIDIRFLAFPDERTQSEIANQLFSTTDWIQVVALTSEHEIDYLMVDLRGPGRDWLSTGAAAPFTSVYQSASLVVLETWLSRHP